MQAGLFCVCPQEQPKSLRILYVARPLLNTFFIRNRIRWNRAKVSQQNAWEGIMQDFLFLGTVLVFFVIAIGYTYGCDRL